MLYPSMGWQPRELGRHRRVPGSLSTSRMTGHLNASADEPRRARNDPEHTRVSSRCVALLLDVVGIVSFGYIGGVRDDVLVIASGRNDGRVARARRYFGPTHLTVRKIVRAVGGAFS
jgi:hypothetical protein